MFNKIKLRRKRKDDNDVDSTENSIISQDHIYLEPLNFKISKLLLNNKPIPLGERKKNIRNTVRVDSYGEVILELSIYRDNYIGEIIVHVFFSTKMPETFIEQTTCTLQFRPSKITQIGSSETIISPRVDFITYFENIPISYLTGSTKISKGFELRLPCNFCSGLVRITLSLCTDTPEKPVSGKPFYLTSFSSFLLGYNITGSKDTAAKKYNSRVQLLSNIDIQTQILELCQDEQSLPGRHSVLCMLEIILRYYIIRPSSFEDQFILTLKMKEFITQNIILSKFPCTAQKAGQILSLIIMFSPELKLQCINSLTKLLPMLSQCSSTEAIDTFYDLMIKCRNIDMKKAVHKLVSQYQKTCKIIYENQSNHYISLASHHPDLVNDFPLDIDYIPPVTITSNSFTSYRNTIYYNTNTSSDILFDFHFEPMALYRLVIISTLASQIINETKLIVIYYWPVGVDYKQPPKFIAMETSNDREIIINIDKQLLLHGIRVLTIPIYPKFYGICSLSNKSQNNNGRILTVIKLFGEDPFKIMETLNINHIKLKREKENYNQLKKELLKQIQLQHYNMYDLTIKRLRDTRIQYLQYYESFLQLFALSKVIINDESSISVEEESIRLPHYALILTKLSIAINDNKSFLSCDLNQITLKTLFRYITGILVPFVRNEAAKALTILINKSNTWNTWVIDILLEYFTSQNTTRAFKTIPKKLVLSILQVMIPFSASTNAAGQIFALMEATMAAKSKIDFELIGWLLLTASGNELFKKEQKYHGSHVGSICSNCDMRPIYGIRYRCAFCIDYDLCVACEQKSHKIHNPNHEFVVIKTPLPPYPHAIQSGSDFHVSAILKEPLYIHDNNNNDLLNDNNIDNNTDNNTDNKILSPMVNNNISGTLIHQFTVCYECGIAPIIGARYKCLYCPNFDYCERCFLTQDHIEHHVFIKKKKVNSKVSLNSNNDNNDSCLTTLLHPSLYPRSIRTGTNGSNIRSPENIALKHLVKRNSGSHIKRSKSKTELQKKKKISYIFPDNIAWNEERNTSFPFPDYEDNPLITLIRLLSKGIDKHQYIFQLTVELLEQLTQQASIDIVSNYIIIHPCFSEILTKIYYCESFSQIYFLKYLDSILQKDFYQIPSGNNYEKSSENIKKYLISHTQNFLTSQHAPNEVEYALDILSLCLRYEESKYSENTKKGSEIALSPKVVKKRKFYSSTRTTSPLVKIRHQKKTPSVDISDIPLNLLNEDTSNNDNIEQESYGIPVTRTKAFSHYQHNFNNMPSNIPSSNKSPNRSPNITPFYQQNNNIIPQSPTVPPKNTTSNYSAVQKIKLLSDTSKTESESILNILEDMKDKKRKKPIPQYLFDLLLDQLEIYPLSSNTIQIWNRVLHLLRRGEVEYIVNSKKLHKFIELLLEAPKIHKNLNILSDALKKLFQIILSSDINPEIYYIYLLEATKQINNLGINDNCIFLELLLQVLNENSRTRIIDTPQNITQQVLSSLANYIKISDTDINLLLVDNILDLLLDLIQDKNKLSSFICDSNPLIWHSFLDYLDKISNNIKNNNNTSNINNNNNINNSINNSINIPSSSYINKDSYILSSNINDNKLSLFVHTILYSNDKNITYYFLKLFNERLYLSPGNETIKFCTELLSNEDIAIQFVKEFSTHEFLLKILVGEQSKTEKTNDLTELLLQTLQPGPEPLLVDSLSSLENLNSLAKVIASSADSLLTKSYVLDFKEPYLISCQFPFSVIINSICVTIYSEYHQHPPKSITISTFTSELSFIESTFIYEFKPQTSNIYRFDIPNARPCYFISVMIKPYGESMQLCNITFLGQSLKSKQLQMSNKNISFSFAALLMEKLLSFNNILTLISNQFSKEPFLLQLLELCYHPLQDKIENILRLLSYSSPIIANSIVKHVLQLPNKTISHAKLVEHLCTSLLGNEKERLILLRDFVFNQLNQYDVIPFIDALSCALLNKNIIIQENQMDKLLSQIKNSSINSSIYNRSMKLLCIIISYQPEYYKQILNSSSLVKSNNINASLVLHLNDLNIIGQLCNSSPICADLLLQSELLEDLCSVFQDLLKEVSIQSKNLKRRSSISIFNSVDSKERTSHSSSNSLSYRSISSLFHRTNSNKSLILSNITASIFPSNEPKLPKQFQYIANFFIEISHSIKVKQWANKYLIITCLRMIPDKNNKYRKKLLEIISVYCNNSKDTQEIVYEFTQKYLDKLSKISFSDNWQTYIHYLVNIKYLFSIKNEISCCLHNSEKYNINNNNTNNNHLLISNDDDINNLSNTNNIYFNYIKKMISNAPKDTFQLLNKQIATNSVPSLRTIINPDPLTLPFSIEVEITESSDYFSSNNLFIGFIGNRNGHSSSQILSSYSNKAIGNSGYSISFSGEYIFQLGNSYYTQTSHPQFVVGDIIQATINEKGNVSFKINGLDVYCDFIPSFSLPVDTKTLFYFGISVYNITARFDIRPKDLEDNISSNNNNNNIYNNEELSSTNTIIKSYIRDDLSSLRFIRINSMYRIPSTLKLYELIPKIIDNYKNRDELKITFTIQGKSEEPLPLSASINDLLLFSPEYNELGIIDIEYTCMLRDATDENDTLYNEIIQASNIIAPSTCYNILNLFIKHNGLISFIKILQIACNHLFDPNIPQTLYILRYIHQLLLNLNISGYIDIFIANNECMNVFFTIIQWIIKSVYISYTDVNQLQDKNNLELSESQLLSSLYNTLIELFKLPGKKTMIQTIRKSVISCKSLHYILIYLGQIEQVSQRRPDLFYDDLKDEYLQVKGIEKHKLKPSKSSKSFWASGTGFGTYKDQQSDWKPETFAKKQLLQSKLISKILNILTSFIIIPDITSKSSKRNIIPDSLYSILESSCIIPIIESYLRNNSILDILTFIDLYKSIFAFLRSLASNYNLVPLYLPLENQNQCILELIDKMKSNIEMAVLRTSQSLSKSNNEQILLLEDIDLTLKQMTRSERKMKRKQNNNNNKDKDSYIKSIEDNNNSNNKKKEIKTKNKLKEIEILKDKYEQTLKKYQYGELDGIASSKRYKYHDNTQISTVSKETTQRLITELSTLSSTLPLHWNSSVYLCVDSSNISVMQVLITGPAKTPYANGCFLFDVYCGPRYPHVPPLVNLQTTGYGRVRFNPNLYKCGKVCLSLLGTWKGAQTEQWRKDTSTLLQVFVSIQALIFVEHPYFNEPSYERWIGTPMGWVSSRAYNENIKPETIRYGMVDMLRKPPKGFENVIQNHFTLKKKEILQQVSKWEKEQVHNKSSLRIAVNELKEELSKL